MTYELPWWDAVEEAESRLEALEDDLNGCSESSILEGSRRTNESSQHMAPLQNPVDSGRTSLTLSCVLTNHVCLSGRSFLV